MFCPRGDEEPESNEGGRRRHGVTTEKAHVDEGHDDESSSNSRAERSFMVCFDVSL